MCLLVSKSWERLLLHTAANCQQFSLVYSGKCVPKVQTCRGCWHTDVPNPKLVISLSQTSPPLFFLPLPFFLAPSLSLPSSLPPSFLFTPLYQIGVTTRSTVPSFSPELRTSGLFPHSRSLQQLILTKIINGERASYHAPKFLRLTNRSRAQLLLELTESLTEYTMATKQGRATRKINRRANWLPVGATW